MRLKSVEIGMGDEIRENDTGLTGCAYTKTEGMWLSFRNVKSGM